MIEQIFNMGGHALDIWIAYALTIIALIITFAACFLKNRHFARDNDKKNKAKTS